MAVFWFKNEEIELEVENDEIRAENADVEKVINSHLIDKKLLSEAVELVEVYEIFDADVKLGDEHEEIFDELRKIKMAEVISNECPNNFEYWFNRALALWNLKPYDISDLSVDRHSITVDGTEYKVYTEDELTTAKEDYAKMLWDDQGLMAVSDHLREEIIEKCVDTDYFYDMMLESYEYYARDIESDRDREYTSAGFVNRLHSELCAANIMYEPEYPDEPDRDNFDTDEEYEEFVEQWEKEIEDLKSDYENEASGLTSELAEHLCKDYKDDGVKWYIDNFGKDAFTNYIAKNSNLIDSDAAIEMLADELSDEDISSTGHCDDIRQECLSGHSEYFYIFEA